MGGEDTTDTSEVSHAALATAVLEGDVGTWDADLEIQPSPTAPVQYQKGLATRTLIAERWLVVDLKVYSGVTGHGVYGWDPHAQHYTGIWVDNMGGAIARATGHSDLPARTMTYDVEVPHGGRVVRYREVTQTVDADTQIYTHLVPLPLGGEHPMIKITYRRRRSSP
jgi:hypothetical protein